MSEEEFIKQKRKELKKIIPGFIEEELSDTVLSFYERGIKEGVKFGIDKQKELMLDNSIKGVITFDYYSGDKTYGCVAHESFCLEDRGLKDRDEVRIYVFKDD